MSISIMTEVWKIEGLSSSQKLVFLSLADNANDQGECYPSMRQISTRTCLSERAVRDAVRALESLGYVRSVSRLGTSTMYHLSTTPANAAAPAANAPRQQMPPTPAPIAAPPRQEAPPTPAAAAPKPSINHQLKRQLTVKAPGAKARAVQLPTDFEISDRVQQWADEKGHTNLQDHLEYFVGYAKANGKKYVNWDEAFMNAIRGNWAKLPAGSGFTSFAGKTPNRQEALEARNREVAERFARGS